MVVAKEAIYQLQLQSLSNPGSENFKQEKHQEQLVPNLCYAEEAFLRQKSRIKWLNEGDSNSIFFHKYVQVKHFRDQIKVLYTLDGRQLTSQEEISDEAVSFFKNLLGSTMPSFPQSNVDELNRHLSDQAVQDVGTLLDPVLATNITNVIKHSPSNKAPGPDGYISEFFKASWDITRPVVVQAIQKFFTIGKLLTSINSTWITFVPKCANPTTMTNFRPISCCNLPHKCITKILANRIQSCLPSIISRN